MTGFFPAAYFKKQPIIFQFFMSYVFVTLIFAAGTVLLNSKINSSFKLAAEESGMAELMKAADSFEQHLSEIEHLLYALSEDSDIRTAAGLQGELLPVDYIKLKKLIDNSKRYYVSTGIVRDMHFWFPASQTAKIQDSIVRSQMDYFSQKYRLNGIGYDEFFSSFAELNEYSRLGWADITFLNKSRRALLYSSNLSAQISEGTDACVFIEINTDIMESLFNFFPGDEYGGFDVINGSDILFSTSDSITPLTRTADFYRQGTDASRSKDYVSLSYKPQNSRLVYVLNLSDNYFKAKTADIRNFLLKVNILLFTGVFIFAAFLSWKQSAPIKRIASILGEERGGDLGKNELDTIYYSANKLLQDKGAIENALKKHLAGQREAYFARALRGGFISADESAKAYEGLQTQTGFQSYFAAYICFDPMPADIETGMPGAFLPEYVAAGELLRDSLPSVLYMSQTDDVNTTLICGHSRDDCVEDTIGAIEKTLRFLWDSYRISAYCGVGGVYSDFFYMSASFREACAAAEKHKHGGSRLIRSETNNNTPSLRHYPIELELGVFRLCKAGDYENIEIIINELFDSVKAYKENGAAEHIQLAYCLRSTILRIISELSLEDNPGITARSSILLQFGGLDKLRENALAILRDICQSVKKASLEKRRSLYEDILSYIRANFGDSSLCLAGTADHFGLNEKYLSHFFKDEGGVNFSTVVEQTRMENVIRMMMDTDTPISEICLECGYSSVNSFYKAFKRIYNISPNVYRQAISNRADTKDMK